MNKKFSLNVAANIIYITTANIGSAKNLFVRILSSLSEVVSACALLDLTTVSLTALVINLYLKSAILASVSPSAYFSASVTISATADFSVFDNSEVTISSFSITLIAFQ